MRKPTLVGAVGGEAVRLLEGAEVDLLAGLALAVQADGLDLDDVVRLLLQVPQDAGAAGGVDFTDEALRVSFLSLGSDRTTRVQSTGLYCRSLLLFFLNGASNADSHSVMLFFFKKSRTQFAANTGLCLHSLFK